MRKIFKGLSILVASTALCGGIAMATACDGGYNGTYTGEYHYLNYGENYGMVVEVTVENNIITAVKDVTNTEASLKDYQDNKEWHVVSPGWEDYFDGTFYGGPTTWLLWNTTSTYEDDEGNEQHYITAGETKVVTDKGEDAGTVEAGKQYYKYLNKEGKFEGQYVEWEKGVYPDSAATAINSYKWSNDDAKNWTTYENWLLQQYVGWSVADVLAIDVFYGDSGEPYGTKGGYNAELAASGLLISNATQGSGRLMLAVQNALQK